MEGIFLILAMRNVIHETLHCLLLSVGLLIPLLMVFFGLGFSLTSAENIYLTNYDADGKLLLHSASFEDMTTLCWLRPDYIIKMVNLPVGFILFSNIVALFTAVTSAYKSAVFRFCVIQS